MIKKTLFFSNPAYLSMKNRQIVIRMPEVEKSNVPDTIKKEAEIKRPIEDVGFIILDNQQITITSGLMAALLDNNCAVVTCDERRMPNGLLLPLSGNSLQSERFRNQIDASLPLKKQLWQQTIQAKILNQSAILDKYSQEKHPCMGVWAKEVVSGDSKNVEARAAAYYWKNLFEGVSGITDFIRDRDGFAPNNLLNYGYAILRAVVARSLVGSGLLPTFGIHHHNRYNAYCLADDVMEPYRPYVDELVYNIIAERGIPDELTVDFKRELLSIPTLDVVIDGKRSPLMIATQQTTASLAKCFAGEVRKIDYPKM